MILLSLQDGHRQQQYIDHLEGEVERLQQLLQVQPAGCDTTAWHEFQHLAPMHAPGLTGMILTHHSACYRLPIANRLGRGGLALHRAAGPSRQTLQQTTPQHAQAPWRTECQQALSTAAEAEGSKARQQLVAAAAATTREITSSSRSSMSALAWCVPVQYGMLTCASQSSI